MSRFPSTGSGGSSAYTYVQDEYPGDAKEGESLYHAGEDRAYVYTGTSWIEQTVAAHSDLSGIGPDNHHTRYTDSEAGSAAKSKLEDVSVISGTSTDTLAQTSTVVASGNEYALGGTVTCSTDNPDKECDAYLQVNVPNVGWRKTDNGARGTEWRVVSAHTSSSYIDADVTADWTIYVL